ncbi:MAG: transporter substrate-binding domain-containing protein [Lysobacterales bacterium]
MTRTSMPGLLVAVIAMFTCAHAAPPAGADAASGKPATAAKHRSAIPVTGDSVLARLDRTGTLRVGVAVNVPWVSHDKDGQLIGYSIDVAKQVAADMGWKLDLVTTSWPKLVDGLRTDRYDVVISGLSITPQRARLVRFTRPYGEYDISLVVNRSKASATDIAGFLKGNPKRVAVRKGTLNVAIARDRLPGAEIIEVDDESQAIADLRAGKYDAFVAEAPTPHLLQLAYPNDLRELGEPLGRTAHGMAVRLGDRELRHVLDAWIIQNQASGWLKQRADFWFNGTAWANQL